MARVQANGWDFECEVTGQGPDLIFIHGEIHGAEYFEHQVAEFSKDHRCLVYVRRGHAGTGAPDYGYSLENQTRDLEALVEYFDIRNPVIVAVAFGTTIAANYAMRHPDDVRGIVMVAWSELHDARKYFDRWVKASEQVVAAYDSGGREAVYEFLRREAGRSVYLVINTDSPIREEAIQMFGRHPMSEYTHGMLEFATSVPDLIEPFSKLSVPVLGVCGDLDPFPDQPQTLAGMANFHEAPMIKGSGRFIQWEKPGEFNAILREFLASLD
jgi:pimeloyl-ACP methyl ester carboxylesterase